MSISENKMVPEGQVSAEKLFVVAGWELDLDTLLLYPDSAHRELLSALGYEDVPEVISLLEYAQRFVIPEDEELIRARVDFAISQRNNPSYADRFELRLKAADKQVHFFLINSWAVRPGIIKGQGQNISDLKTVRNLIRETSSSLKAVIENTDDYIFIVKCSGELVIFNDKFKQVMADFYSINISPGLNILDMIPAELAAQWHPLLLAASDGQRQVQEMDVKLENVYRVEVAVNPIVENSIVDSVSFFIKDITAKWRLSRLDALEATVFEKAFKNKKLQDVADTLLLGIEQLLPAARCYVTKKKKDVMALEWLSAPSLPPSYLAMIQEIPIDENSGSCGLAAQSMEPVLISDIREHACWDVYREITLLAGFQSCFSFPVISRDGAVLGTLGAYFPEVHEISDYEMKLFMRAVNVVGILIEKDFLQQEMQLHHRQIEDIGASIPGVIYIVSMDRNGTRRFDYVSEGVERYLNITRELALESYESIITYVQDQDKKMFAKALQESLQSKSMMEIEFRLSPEVKPDFHCFFLRAVHQFNEDGTVLTYGSVFDITRLKLVERNMLQKQMELEALMKATDDLVLVLNEDNVFVDYFCKDEEVLYRENTEFLGKTLDEIMPPEVVLAYETASLKLKDGAGSAEFFYELEKNNQLKYFRARITRVSGTDFLLLSIMDCTEKRNLNRINDELSAILNEAGTYASFGSVKFNMSAKKLVCSDPVYNLLGLTSEKRDGDCFDYFFSMVHEEDRPALSEILKEAEQQAQGIEIVHRIRHAYGHHIWLRMHLKADRDPRSNDFLLQGIIMEITACKLAELELKKRHNLTEAVSLLTMKLISDDSLENPIRQLLSAIGDAFDVSTICLYKNGASGHTEEELLGIPIMEWFNKNTHAELRPERRPEFDYHSNGCSRWADMLSRGIAVNGHVHDFPYPEKSMLEAQNMKSILLVPVFSGNDWWGFLSFEECLIERTWNDDDISYLAAIGNLIGATLEKRKYHLALKESESLYRTAANTLSDGLVVTNEAGVIVSCNQSACKILQVSANDLLFENAENQCRRRWKFYHADGSEMQPDENPLFRSLAGCTQITDQVMGLSKEGDAKTWLLFNAAPLPESTEVSRNGMLISFCDITTLKNMEKRLHYLELKSEAQQMAYQEKISADMGILTGIIRLQQLFSNNEQLKRQLECTAGRIEVMALAYQTVFSSGQFSGERFGVYLDKICSFCSQLNHAADRNIRMSCNYSESTLSHTEMLACVLLIFEALSNSFRHAFKNTAEGEVRLNFQSQGDYYVVDIADNGSGLPQGFNWESSPTLGIVLMRNLTRMLNGALTIENNKGLRLLLTFPKRTF